MKIYLFLISFLIFSSSYAQITPSSFLEIAKTFTNTNTQQMVEPLTNYYTYINWTQGEIVTEYCIPITYNDRNIGRNIQNITGKLKERVLQYMLGAIPFVRTSSDFTLGDLFKREQRIQLNTLSLVYEQPLENTTITNSKVKGQIAIQLYGTNSISSLLYQNIIQRDITNYLQRETTDTQFYDTVIIDTIMFPLFKPSLNPRILDPQGNVIHDISTVNQDILTQQNAVHFVTSITEALNHPKTGRNISYILPRSVEGVLSSDITLFDTDVRKIFGQQRTLNNLKRGNVIIIIPNQ